MTARPGPDAVLEGCVIVIAADRRSADLAAALERRGAVVHCAPALSIIPAIDDDELITRTRELIVEPPDIVVVTTGVGLRGWMDAVDQNDLHASLSDALAGARFVARGPKAHGAIQQAGFTADWVAESETSAEVAEYLIADGAAGRRIAVQHHGAGADDLDEQLERHGAQVVPLTVYRWGPPPDPDVVRRSVLQTAAGGVDAVLFTSAPGAREWVRIAESQGVLDRIRERAYSGRLLLASVGPITAGPLDDVDLPTRIAARGRLGSLVRSVVEHYSGREPRLATAAGELQVRSAGAVLDGRLIGLSPASASILGALFDARGRVLSREELGHALPRGGERAHAVEMAIARLRDRLGGGDTVQTVTKRGYRLTTEEPE
ncbi:uroporphyrinogen-III synthase [Microbacterium sp. W4I4]|uniref:uroporphyrinogen-III synthase n=1 Tax=Microbacterium sp. W4I4 TaxID=3042295 RepID=UPI002786460E|nr:uroporphyrinogen-III synthase [Microbacterium sp. W4I4]MDQ0612812.1 uroporphyrinogen-III synthase [Microbacterium sp. W4I4]